jgi:hypothetical protein
VGQPIRARNKTHDGVGIHSDSRPWVADCLPRSDTHERYSHLQPDHLRTALDALDNAMGIAPAPQGHNSVTNSLTAAASN